MKDYRDVVCAIMSNPSADGMLIEDQEESNLGDDEEGSPVEQNIESMLRTPQESGPLNDENAISYNELFYNQSPYESQLNNNSPLQAATGGRSSTAGNRNSSIHMKSVHVIQRREIPATSNQIGNSHQENSQLYKLFTTTKTITDNSLSDLTELHASSLGQSGCTESNSQVKVIGQRKQSITIPEKMHFPEELFDD